MRLHEEGVLLPPRINPKADLESAVKEIQGEGQSEAGKWLKEAFLGHLFGETTGRSYLFYFFRVMLVALLIMMDCPR